VNLNTFFQTVLPSVGVKFLAEFVPIDGHPKGGIFVHHPFEAIDDMVDKALKIDERGRTTVYHACAGYKEVKFKTSPKGKQYAVGRTQDNATHARALWQDFDVGKYNDEGELVQFSYATRNEALAAIKDLMKRTGLPRPLLVSSGNGFHAYWPFTEDVTKKEWLYLTSMVRTVYEHVGIKFDPSRDTDIASVLRPVGTRNKGKEVEVLRDTTPMPYQFYLDKFRDYIEANELVATPPSEPKVKLENEFGPAEEYPESSLELVADKCAQIALFRDTGCDTEPLWFRNLCVAAHCVDGDRLAHEWGAKSSKYDEDATNAKLDQIRNEEKGGPTTCEKFQKVNAEGCKNCAFAGKIKGPIALGRVADVVPPVFTEETPEGEVVEVTPPHWPRGFNGKNNKISVPLENKDGVLEQVSICSPLFYFTERIRGIDGTFVYKAKMNVKQSEWRDFEVPAKQLAEARSLKATLASYEIMTDNDKLLMMFASRHATQLRLHKDEVTTFNQFGWNKSRTGFVIGDEIITSKGRSKVRLCADTFKSPEMRDACAVKGTKEEWTSAVMELYNRENGLPYQYAIGTQFGAPLAELLGYEEWNGIPLALTSDDSGYGKTTVTKIGINALYNSSTTMVSETTVNGISSRASVVNNAPMLFDELTKVITDPEDLARICYTLSNGREKVRLGSDGKENTPKPRFKMMSTITANKNFFDKLAQSKTTPIATQMRIFEIGMESYDKLETVKEGSKLHAAHHELALHVVNNCYGVWAEDYFRFIIDNKKLVIDKLHSTAMAIVNKLGGNAAKERFFAYHVACTLVGLWVAKKIGALAFDIPAVRDWAFAHILKMRGVANHYGANTQDMFAKMLSELHGRILVTKFFDLLDARRGKTEMPMLPLKGPIAARLVLGEDGKERGKFYLSISALDEWCAQNDTTPSAFKRQLVKADLLLPCKDGGFDSRQRLSKGVVSLPMAHCRCVEISYSAAQGIIDDYHLDGKNVVAFPVKGSDSVADSVAENETAPEGAVASS